MEPVLTLTDTPAPAAAAAISAGLGSYDECRTGVRDWRALAVLASDPDTGAVLGGLMGGTWLCVLTIDRVFLPESPRGRGLGSGLLLHAEEEARRRGCQSGVLYTMTFQAPNFYARHGWHEFGRIPCNPPGATRVFCRKRFDLADSQTTATVPHATGPQAEITFDPARDTDAQTLLDMARAFHAE